VARIPDRLFVYCDVCAPYITGDTRTPLLRIVPVSVAGHNYSYETNLVKHFSLPHYIPLQKTNFSRTKIDIRDQLGKRIPFESGTLMVTLHFRRPITFENTQKAEATISEKLNFTMEYDEYYATPKEGGRSGRIPRVFVGSLYQRGHGIESFLGRLFRKILLYLGKGARMIDKEALRAGINVIEDVENNFQLR